MTPEQKEAAAAAMAFYLMAESAGHRDVYAVYEAVAKGDKATIVAIIKENSFATDEDIEACIAEHR